MKLSPKTLLAIDSRYPTVKLQVHLKLNSTRKKEIYNQLYLFIYTVHHRIAYFE